MRIPKDSFIMLGILAVIVLTYVLVIHRAQSARIDKLETKTAQATRQLRQYTDRAACIPGTLREISRMRQRYNADWDRRLPQRKELDGFLRQISAGLDGEDFPGHVIRPGNPEQCRLYNKLPITMSLEGDFLSLAAFLREVDEMTRLTRVERLKIEPSRERDEELDIEIGMNIYFTEH
jgi:Tfp pilus assembly protein PilO